MTLSKLSHKQGLLDWHGAERVSITVSDQACGGGDGTALTATAVLPFTVLPQPDLPQIALPAALTALEDGSVVVRGISVYDADVAAGGGVEDALFEVCY
jgi:hypothetical protein